METLDLEQYKMYGDLLTANAYRFQEPFPPSVTLQNFYEPDYPEIKIPLLPGKDVLKSAESYYKKYKKKKATQEHLKIRIPETKQEMEYLENVSLSISMASNTGELDEVYEELLKSGLATKVTNAYAVKNKKGSKTPSKKDKKPIMPLRFTKEGFTLYLGKNNIQNDFVTFHIGDAHDVWFHAKNIPGSHVIIKNPEEKTIPDDVLLFAARLAGYFSKNREDSYVEVDYTEVKNVKKIKGANPGMVTYTHFSTIRADIIKEKIEQELLTSSLSQ